MLLLSLPLLAAMAIFLRVLNARHFFALLFGMVTPYWIAAAWGLWQGCADAMADQWLQQWTFTAPCYDALPAPAITGAALIAGISVPAIATATDRPPVEAALRRLSLLQYFDPLFTCTEVGKSKRHPDIFLAAMHALGGSLANTVVFVSVAYNFSRSVRENFAVEVLLDDSIRSNELADLKTYLAAQPYTRTVTYISKEEGTRMLLEDLDGRPEDFLGGSPIPAEYEVMLKAPYACPDSLALFMPALTQKPYVRDVIYPIDLLAGFDQKRMCQRQPHRRL